MGWKNRRGGRAGPEAAFGWALKRSWQVSAAMEEASPDLPQGLENLLGKRVSWHVCRERGKEREQMGNTPQMWPLPRSWGPAPSRRPESQCARGMVSFLSP